MAILLLVANIANNSNVKDVISTSSFRADMHYFAVCQWPPWKVISLLLWLCDLRDLDTAVLIFLLSLCVTLFLQFVFPAFITEHSLLTW